MLDTAKRLVETQRRQGLAQLTHELTQQQHPTTLENVTSQTLTVDGLRELDPRLASQAPESTRPSTSRAATCSHARETRSAATWRRCCWCQGVSNRPRCHANLKPPRRKCSTLSICHGGARVNYYLLDDECAVGNDWDDVEYTTPIVVCCMQSRYTTRGWTQFVGTILEKAQELSLVARITKLDELLTSRPLSQSLLAHQPLRVCSNERVSCFCCDAKFDFPRRRHDCRMCGEVCCGECSPKKDVAPPDVVYECVCVVSVQATAEHRVHSLERQQLQQLQQLVHHTASMYSLPVGMASTPRREPSINTPPSPPLPSPPPPPPSPTQLSSSSSSSE